MKKLNWNNAIYYGEVFGFVFAWAICLAIALGHSEEQGTLPDAKDIASANTSPVGLD